MNPNRFVTATAAVMIAASAQAQDTTVVPIDTSYVEYHDSPITLPLGIGLRTPSYDRINGLTLPWGPRLRLGEDRFQLEALVSYRSNLGKWDPSIEGFVRPGRTSEIEWTVGRGTFTNDSWIRSDLANSIAAFFVGSDSRNYFRADRATARWTQQLTMGAFSFTPFIGGNLENDWSTGSFAPTKSPWSFYGRKGDLKMRRPNPEVAKRHIGSFLAGSGIEVFREGLDARLAVTVEHALKGAEGPCFNTPGGSFCDPDDPPFTQVTLDSHATFPTFGNQTFAFKGHAIFGSSGTALVPQRYSYLGGSGTLATVNLLALGGDRLLFVAGEYKFPVEVIQLPYVGGPFLALTYAAGNAGIAELPALIQNIGAGIGLGPFRVDYAIDPASNRSPLSRRSAVSLGFSLSQ
jgi:hypothetical protein